MYISLHVQYIYTCCLQLIPWMRTTSLLKSTACVIFVGVLYSRPPVQASACGKLRGWTDLDMLQESPLPARGAIARDDGLVHGYWVEST